MLFRAALPVCCRHKPLPGTLICSCRGLSAHLRAQTCPIQVYFKPEEVTYERLLDEFFAKVDPTTMNRQGNDMGTQYRSVSFLAVAASLRP